MLRFLVRWIFRIALVLGLAFIAVYVGDWTVFRLRGSPADKVTVSRYVSIPLKGQKTEYDYLGTMDVPCSKALFMQGGQSPCWQLRRHPDQGANF